MTFARYGIVENEGGKPLVIRDLGPWTEHPTVTHDVASVVRELFDKALLPPGRRLFYFDSAGDLDEIVVDGARFVHFAPGRRCIDCGGEIERGEFRCAGCKEGDR